MAPYTFSKPLIFIGLLLLSHACYSAYEHSVLTSSTITQGDSQRVPVSPASHGGLPTDISIETIISVILICLGLVYGAEDLKPINWRIWAGQVERESGGGGPFQGLDERVGFVNIRAKRKEFADWVRSQGVESGG